VLNLLAYYDYCFAFDSIDGLHIACPETGGRFKKKQTYFKPYQKLKKNVTNFCLAILVQYKTFAFDVFLSIAF